MEHTPIQLYEAVDGYLAHLSDEQTSAIQRLRDEFGLDNLRVVNTWIDFEQWQPINVAKIRAFLEKLAPIIHHSNGEIVCTIRILDPLIQFFRIEDGRLKTHYGRVVKGEWKALTAMPTIQSASELNAYDGQLCLTPFQPVYQKIVDYLNTRNPAYFVEIIDGHCLNFKYIGKDWNRYHVEILMNIASIVGEDAQCDGIVQCSIDQEVGDPIYEFYKIEAGILYQQMGHLERVDSL